jgi:serine/threonine-protein kinase
VNEKGEALGIVHRDVSPQNILVGLDGIPRLVDFGVAKAIGRVQTTREGQLKGKIAYMAPEQIRGATPTRLVDVYAAAIVFWEMLTGERLFGGENDVVVLERALHHDPEAPSTRTKDIPAALDTVVLMALARDPAKRFQTAQEMAREIENVTQVASVSKVGEWVESIAGEAIAERAAKVAEIESHSQVRSLLPPLAMSPPSSDPTVGAIDVPVSTSDYPRRPERRRLAAVGAIVALFVVALLTTAIVLHRERANEAATPAPPTTTHAPVATQPADTATATAKPEPTATVTATTSATATATATAAQTAAKRPNIVRDFPTKPGAKAGCNPPYTIDSNGVKQYKMECL